jgi:hypothetical protein
MISARRYRGLPVGLVMLGMATGFGSAPSRGGEISADSATGQLDGTDAPSTRVSDERVSGNPLWTIPLPTLTTTRERPIFSPSRRPPPPAVVAAPFLPPPPVSRPSEPERPQLALVGTVSGEQEAFGIFLDQTENKIIRLKLGDRHRGWTLRQVRGREVMLQKDDETLFLALPPPGTKPAIAGTQVADDPVVTSRISR